MTWWIVQNVVITAGLALVAAAICRFSRIGPVARHALWLVVLVKFVTPPLVVWPWAAPDVLGVSRLAAITADDDAAPATAGTESPPADVRGVDRLALTVLPDGASRTSAVPAAATGTEAAVALWPWLASFWFAGSLAFVLLEAVRTRRVCRLVAAGRPADPSLVARADGLASRLGEAPVPIVVVRDLASPAVWSFGRPRILWPDRLDDGAAGVWVDGLLVHELAHVRRRDHLVGWIELAAGIVWWWNPLFWFVRASLREQAELACDAWVITTLPDGRRAYAESLLTVSSAVPGGHWSMAVVGVRAGTRRILERRLAMIMQGRVPLRLTRIGLCALALTAMVTLPGWAAGQYPPPPPPPEPPVPVAPPAPPAPPVDSIGWAPPTPRTPPTPEAIRTPPPPAPVQAARPPRPQGPPPPPPAPIEMGVVGRAPRYTLRLQGSDLPADGRALLTAFGEDVEAIQREADQKAAERRDAFIKALEALQEEHTKAGRLDDAVAIRNFLRQGVPTLNRLYEARPVIRR